MVRQITGGNFAYIACVEMFISPVVDIGRYFYRVHVVGKQALPLFSQPDPGHTATREKLIETKSRLVRFR